jgi:exoribonuclease R
VDCSIASNAAKMWANSFNVEERNEAHGKDSENDEEDELEYQESLSSTKSRIYEEFHDSDTEEWFQSRRDDPLVQEYIKAFESLVEAFSLDKDDMEAQYYQLNNDEEDSSDMDAFGTSNQPPNWLLEPNNAVSYIGNVLHQEYLDESTVHSKLLNDELLLCTLEISSSSGGSYGYAKVLDQDIRAMLVGMPKAKMGTSYEEHQPDIVISNRSDMNRALHGDIVAVEVISETSQQLRGRVVFLFREVHSRECVCFVDLQDSNIMMPIDKANPSVFVLQSKDHRGEIGVAVFSIKDGETHCQEFVTETSGKLFLVRLLEWGASYRLPLGIVRKCLREASDLNSAVPVFAAEYGIRLSQPAEVLNEVRDLYPDSWRIPDAELKWRSHRYSNAFTLDCRSLPGIELDDAISITRDNTGSFQVGVHVADVSYFVHKDSCVDQAASLQGSSVYPDQENGPSINMLPRRLSQNLCSLLPGQERLAVSVVFKLDSEGKIIKQPDIHRSIVVSCCSLSFEECDDILAGDSKRNLPVNVKEGVLLLSKLTRKIAARQARQGCIAGVADAVHKIGAKSAQIVEQLMIMTNSAVAQKILLSERTKDLAPLRRQMPPKSKLLDSFNQWCTENGVLESGSLTLRRLRDGTPTKNDVIKDMKIELSCLGHISTAINANNLTQLTEALLKCDDNTLMLEAHSRLCVIQERSQYIVSSNSKGVQLKHFTLGLECYTHFTSPLRRYIDIVVHRCLLALIYDEELPYSEKELQKICFDCQVSLTDFIHILI